MTEAIEIVRSMTAVRVPIIAAVNGPAVGLGCSLASMSDIVVVEEHAYFADPHVALGLVAADGGAFTWPLITSLLRAKEYILLGDRLPAAEAVQLGVANRVVPTGESVTVAARAGRADGEAATAGVDRDEGGAQPMRCVARSPTSSTARSAVRRRRSTSRRSRRTSREC